MTKVAVIGLGVMGGHHARVYKELGVLHGVCDINPTLTDMVANQYNCKRYYTLKDLLEDKELDAVSIATPTKYHYFTAMDCLEADLDVLIEKPIAECVQDAISLDIKANRKKRILTCGYIERYNPAVIEMMQLIQNKEFGDITSINMKRVGGIPRSADNVIVDLMTHDLNILLGIFKKRPVSVSTSKLTRDNIVDSAQVLLDFDNATATCEANWISPIKVRRIEITGTAGYGVVDLINQTVNIIHTDTELIKRFNKEPLKAELENFIQAVRREPGALLIYAAEAGKTLDLTLEVAEQ